MALILMGIMLLFRPPYDNDFGWHLRYGEWIVQHLSFPATDFFSYTMTNYVWANSYWASQTVMYLLVKLIGTAGMSLVLSLGFCLFSYYLIFKIVRKNLIAKILLMLLWAIIGTYGVSIRPFFFSSILMLSLVYILSYKQKLFIYVPILFLFWANFHADFMLGLFILGIYCFYQIIKRSDLIKTGSVLLLSILSTLANPYGFGLWLSMGKELLNRKQFLFISEWKPLYLYLIGNNHSVELFFALFMVILLFAIGIFANYKKVPWWRLLIGLVFLILAIRMRYFVRVFLIITVFDAIYYYSALSELIVQKGKVLFPKGIGWVITYVYISLFLVVFTVFARNVYVSLELGRWANYYKMPYGAVNFIRTQKIDGNIFNEYGWGGYLIWQLPQYKTFIDGRMASWVNKDGYFLSTYDSIHNYPKENYPHFLEFKNKYHINLILVPVGGAFYTYLNNYNPPEWKNVYQDEISAVFVSADK